MLATIRVQVRLLQEQGIERARSAQGVVLTVRPEGDSCPQCSGAANVQKTKRRGVATLSHGSFVAKETVQVCASGCRHPSGNLVTRRSEALTQQVASGAVYGYDIEVFVGLARFIHHRQREEIQSLLQHEHGIRISTGEISNLATRFLDHLEELHVNQAPAIRAALVQDGGYPLHIDASGEDGRGTLFVAYAGWRKWVLGAWKLTTERADQVLPCLREVVARFGAPRAIMRDLGRAMTQAAAELVAGLEQQVPILSCHLHFLKDVGKDLMEPAYKQMREQLRVHAVRAGLRSLARDMGRQLGERLPDLRIDVLKWVEGSSEHTLPDGDTGLATIRCVAQWALDYHRDSRGHGFPFDRPHLDLYKRCVTVRRAVDAFIRRLPEDPSVRRALKRLARVLDPVNDESLFSQAAATLTFRGGLFDELRDALRLSTKPVEAVRAGASETAKELKNVQQSIKDLEESLRKRRPERGPAQAAREAIDIILAHLDRHGSTLWGHEIRLPEGVGEGVRFVDRTNNLLEGLFHDVKHGERRRSGRKILTNDFECLPPAAALASNLNRPDYVKLLCGSLEGLSPAFAALDSTREARRLATAPCKTTTRPTSRPEVATASLPLPDRPVVRSAPVRAFVESAARSRAPHYAASAAG